MTRWTFTGGDMGIALSPDVSIKPMRHGTEAGEHLNQRDSIVGGYITSGYCVLYGGG